MRNYLFLLLSTASVFFFSSCEKEYDFNPEISLNIDTIEYRGANIETEIIIESGTSSDPKIYSIERNLTTNEIKYIPSSTTIFDIGSYSQYDCEYNDINEESCLGTFNESFSVYPESFSATQGLRIVSTLAGTETYKDIFMKKYVPDFIFFYLVDNKVYQYLSEEDQELLLDGDLTGLNIENISSNSSKTRVYFKSSNKVYYINPESPNTTVQVYTLPSSFVSAFSTVGNTEESFYYLYNNEVVVRDDNSELYSYELSSNTTNSYYSTNADVALKGSTYNVIYNYLAYSSYYYSNDAIKLKTSYYSSSSSSSILSDNNSNFNELVLSPVSSQISYTTSANYLYNITKGTYSWPSYGSNITSSAHNLDYNNTGDLIFLKSGNIYYTDVADENNPEEVYNDSQVIDEVTW